MRIVISFLGVALVCGCGRPDQKPDVVRHYAELMRANYGAVVDGATKLQTAVDAFVAAPSAETHAAAKQAWLDVRPAYGQSEVSRFYGGPIDANGLEHRINAWPVDENFIDYTQGNPTAGLINQTAMVPHITEQVLSAYNGRAGDENRAIGFHAIEFLLWGQRVDQTQGPGKRSYTDYVDGMAPNADRRRDYLRIVTSMLVADLNQVYADWDLGDTSSYASALVKGSADDALSKLMRGMANMAIAELLYERLYDPYITKDQKDEESRFSENTWVDLAADSQGVQNVYLGRFGDLEGPSISDMVAARDPALDATTKSQLQAARGECEKIPAPFDQAVLQPDDGAGRVQVKRAIDAWSAMLDTFPAIAKTLGADLNFVSQ